MLVPETVAINGVQMRKNSVGTAIVLSIVTLGIFWLVLVYRNTMDLHRALGKETTLPLILFIVSIPFPLLWLALFSLNGIRLNELREEKQKPTDHLWIVALIFHIVFVFLTFVGSIIWAVMYDNTLDEIGPSTKTTDFTHVA